MRDRDRRESAGDSGPVQRRELGVGKGTLIDATFGASLSTGGPLQLQALQPHAARTDGVHAEAVNGIKGPAGELPHLTAIQRAFGHHDVAGVSAHVGGPATTAARAIGAEAYATGNHVAFAGAPSLHTAAHEAAHVVQQRGGVQLKGGVGAAGDPYEQRADQVADAVVAGLSAESLLDSYAPSSSGAPVAAVQRQPAADAAVKSPGAPASRGESSIPAANAQEAGHLAQLLASPASGLGDPVVSYLLTLPMPALLDQLAEAVECGYALQLESRVVAAPPILMGALQATELARTRPLTASHPVLQRAGAALDRVSHDQQVQILSWMLARGGVSIRATTLVEGVIAMREAGVRPGEQAADVGLEGESSEDPEREHTLGEDVEHSVAAVNGAATGMPPPIEPKRWAAPGKQPRWLYIGNDAHEGIAQFYQAAHPGDDVATNSASIGRILDAFAQLASMRGRAIDRAALAEGELLRRPDILNITREHIYEIKPENAQAAAAAKVRMYASILDKAGIAISLGPVGEPGTIGALPAPEGVFMFESVEPGVITYKYRPGMLVPVPVPAHERARNPNAERWKWELRPHKLTPAQEQAIVTTTVGGAMLILVMILLAPVGA